MIQMIQMIHGKELIELMEWFKNLHFVFLLFDAKPSDRTKFSVWKKKANMDAAARREVPVVEKPHFSWTNQL